MSYNKLLKDEINSLRLKLSLQTSLKEFLKKELTATDAKVVELKSELVDVTAKRDELQKSVEFWTNSYVDSLAMSRSLVNCQEEIIKLIEENAALKREVELNRWIPISERLPGKNGRYWCYDINYGKPYVVELRFDAYNETWFNDQGDIFHPTHWREITKP